MMFRGEVAHVWVRRLVAMGWPRPAAEKMAAALCDRKTPMPKWSDLVSSPSVDIAERAK